MSVLVDLLVCELRPHDATSTHTILLGDLLAEKGAEVRFVVDNKTSHKQRKTSYKHSVVPLNRWRADADLTILQHSIGSQIAQHVIDKQLPVVVNYHNITPPELFEAWQPDLIPGLKSGQTQLWQLASLTLRGLADSRFNSRDMIKAGIKDVVVVPVLRDFDGPALKSTAQPTGQHPAVSQADSVSANGPSFNGGTLLFVGRLVPNKCYHDLILALRMLVCSRPQARLVLAGQEAMVDYKLRLKALAKKLEIEDRVVFAGEVNDAELKRWYRQADVFVCVSEHEGFCVPLVEAMSYGLPVVAYDAAAVAETVRDGGIVLHNKQPATVAAAVSRVLGDSQVRDLLVKRGIQRSRQFDISITRQQMWQALRDLLPTE